jgi:hypothetical protein
MEKYHPRNQENKVLVDEVRKLQAEEAERVGFVELTVCNLKTKKIIFKGNSEAVEEALKR